MIAEGASPGALASIRLPGMDPVDTATAALSRWCAREVVVGLRPAEVLPKQASDHRHGSLLFCEGFHGEDTTRRFAEYLRGLDETHPHDLSRKTYHYTSFVPPSARRAALNDGSMTLP